MIQLSRQNVVSGAIIFALGVFFFIQSSHLDDAMATASIHPMEYPKALLYILMALGICIILSPAKKVEQSSNHIPLCSIQTLLLFIVLIAYATLLEKIGFVVTSFAASCLVAYLMNWRKPLALIVSNSIGIFCIWALFKYVLKIPLPSGILF